MIIKIKPADSRYERGTDGGQVTGPDPSCRSWENRPQIEDSGEKVKKIMLMRNLLHQPKGA